MGLVVLAGGVGGARFLSGLVRVSAPETVTAIVNTGDDAVFHGLYISPDIDIVTYTLAGMVNEKQGWGVLGDSFHCLGMLARLGHETWFNLGDKDLAIHIHRSERLLHGFTLAQVTEDIREALGVKCRIIPMTNQPVRTRIDTGKEIIPFQEYFVKRRCREPVKGVIYDGVEKARAAPGVLEAIRDASAVIIPPGNPFLSIGTILSLKKMRRAILRSRARVIAISPIVGGKTIKGPADEMMRTLGHEVSAVGIARIYQDILDKMVIDKIDAGLKEEIEHLGIEVLVADTLMNTAKRRRALAAAVVKALGCGG